MIQTSGSNRQLNYLRLLQGVLLVGVLMYVGQPLFVPLSFALLISFVLYPFCKRLELLGVPRVLAIVLGLTLIIVLLGGIVALMVVQLVRFGREWPLIKDKLEKVLLQFSTYLRDEHMITVEQQMNWVKAMGMDLSAKVFPFLQGLLYSSAVTAVLLILIPLYVLLILYYREQLAAFLFSLFDPSEHQNVNAILHQTIGTYYNFIKGMAIVYLVVAVLNSIGLAMLGVPYAILFGVMASLLTFIPYVGITVGSILPMAVAWITFDSLWYPLGVVGVFTFVQYLEANVIFPMAVSFRLQVNTLFTIIAIVAGGIIWGAAGMILFIPFLAILKLIADKNENLRPLGLLLGGGKPAEEKKKKKRFLY